MAVYPRNLLLFVALAGAAFATWMLARQPEEPAGMRTVREPVPEGYYMGDAVIHGTNNAGHVYYRLYADHAEQEADNDDFVLEGIRVQYTPETGVHWSIAAERGMAPASREFFDLLGGVRLSFAAPADQETVSFAASELRLYPDEFRATSSGRIDMRKGQRDISATGLELDLNTDDFTLGSEDRPEDFNVRIRSAR